MGGIYDNAVVGLRGLQEVASARVCGGRTWHTIRSLNLVVHLVRREFCGVAILRQGGMV